MNKTKVQQTHYTIYQITNQINNKIYIGKHKTSDLHDNYMGSGKLIQAAIEKYGIENFTKEILFVFDNKDDMNVKEAEIVTSAFVLEESNYNLNTGGNGGWAHVNSNEELRIMKNRKARIAANNVIKEKYGVTNTSQLPHVKELFSANMKKRHKNGEFRQYPAPSFKGKKHTNETKQKIGQANSKHQSGPSNSQFGTMWITNGRENKKISKNDVIPNGWHKGRTMRM